MEIPEELRRGARQGSGLSLVSKHGSKRAKRLNKAQLRSHADCASPPPDLPPALGLSLSICKEKGQEPMHEWTSIRGKGDSPQFTFLHV